MVSYGRILVRRLDFEIDAAFSQHHRASKLQSGAYDCISLSARKQGRGQDQLDTLYPIENVKFFSTRLCF